MDNPKRLQGQKPAPPVHYLLLAGLALLAVGVVLGLIPHGDCGSMFLPKDMSLFDAVAKDNGLIFSDRAGECATRLSGVKPWVFGLLGLGALAVLGDLFIRSQATARAHQ